jgi:hypothetical protein
LRFTDPPPLPPLLSFTPLPHPSTTIDHPSHLARLLSGSLPWLRLDVVMPSTWTRGTHVRLSLKVTTYTLLFEASPYVPSIAFSPRPTWERHASAHVRQTLMASPWPSAAVSTGTPTEARWRSYSAPPLSVSASRGQQGSSTSLFGAEARLPGATG